MGNCVSISRHFRETILAAFLAASACSSAGPGPGPAQARTPIGQLPDVDMTAVLAHTRTLSSDEFEGRAPGTKGAELAVAYVTDQFKSLGLKPGNTDGTYVQKVPLVGITPAPASLVFKRGGQSRT